jgi:pilus assembly protein Flp/PilA
VAQYAQFVSAWMTSLKTREDDGQGLVEYGLLVALIAVICIGAVTALGGSISTTLNSAATGI